MASPVLAHSLRAYWLGLAGLGLSLLLLSHFSPLLYAPSQTYLDWLTRERAATRTADPRLVLIDIDDLSLTALSAEAGPWPWPRAIHAELLDFLTTQTPSAVIFDVLFSEADTQLPAADAYFNEALARAPHSYLAMLVQQAQTPSQAPLLSSYPASLWRAPAQRGHNDSRALLLTPNAIEANLWRSGHINLSTDADGVARRHQLFWQHDGWRLPSLPARVAHDLQIPLPTSQEWLIDWPSAQRTPHSRVSYANVLAVARGQLPLSAIPNLQQRLIVIGTSASGLHDIRRTPIDPLYPAPFILTSVLDNLLNGHALQRLPALSSLIASLLILFLSCLLFAKAQPRYAYALLAAYLTSLALGSWWLARQGWLLDIVPSAASLMLVGLMALAMLHRQRQLQLESTVRVFNRFMDPNVVHALLSREDPETLLSSKECQITVLFSDIRSFTSLSEQRPPREIVALLEGYFARQVDVLFQHQATLDKFIGDAVMAFWGAPLDTPDHARLAIDAALQMLDNLEAFRRDYQCPEFDIGIGIHTGPAVVGLIGASQRYDYTAIGDTVNLASRIEGLTKGRASLLVSAATRAACAEHFDFTPQGAHQVKGRLEAVELFTPHRRAP
ncbi:adenylate/guanylate cyclase domain-containing protein [Atopomonas hussainii]|uniref:adenylate/guanylate cyclase domain-containing protein n=1 Tax=Atopomonas hussainii TaxID=1429083 RepID=UPI00090044F3|nr:adenylate/guanylate cyclase domain-containing protein [Atopomonas hussainii]